MKSFENDQKEGFYPSADSVHDAASAYFRDDLDGFHMSASRSCCALPASMRGCAAGYTGRCRTSGGGAPSAGIADRNRIHTPGFEVDIKSSVSEFAVTEHLPEQLQNGGRHPLVDEQVLITQRFCERTARRLARFFAFGQVRLDFAGQRETLLLFPPIRTCPKLPLLPESIRYNSVFFGIVPAISLRDALLSTQEIRILF